MIFYRTKSGKIHQRGEVFTKDMISRTIMASDYKEPLRVLIPADEVDESLDIDAFYYPSEDCMMACRKLTPKEYFRLQGWTDDYYERAAFINTKTQLYKQAGNGVTVDVIKAISEKFNGEDQT